MNSFQISDILVLDMSCYLKIVFYAIFCWFGKEPRILRFSGIVQHLQFYGKFDWREKLPVTIMLCFKGTSARGALKGVLLLLWKET